MLSRRESKARSFSAALRAILPRPRSHVMLDFVRVAAATLIVWAHTPEPTSALKPFTKLAGFAIPFFTMAAVFLVLETKQRCSRPFRGYATSRFVRIYPPFLGWSLVYVAAWRVNAAFVSGTVGPTLSVSILYTDVASHLWFLPFILMVTLACSLIASHSCGNGELSWGTVPTLLAAGTVVACISGSVASPLGYIAFQSFNALPAVFFGLAFALLYRASGHDVFRSVATVVVAAAVLLICTVCMVWLAFCGRHEIKLLKNLAGLAAMVLAVQTWSHTPVRWVARLGPLTFGAYLVHILFVEGLQDCLRAFGHEVTWPLDIPLFCASLVLSFGAALLLRQWRLTCWLAP